MSLIMRSPIIHTPRDSDLRSHFSEVVRAKGTHAVKVSWVTGHASQEHVEHGITTAERKRGNDTADRLTDEGTDLNASDVLKAARYFSLTD